MKYKIKRNPVIYFLLITVIQTYSISAFSQESTVDEIRARFADANAIYLKKKYEYIISIEKDQLKGICNVEEQKIINKNNKND